MMVVFFGSSPRTSFTSKHKATPVPYCEKHLKLGDDALKVYMHPKGFGKILVARFNLPKGYRMVYHGLRRSTGSDADLDPDEDRTLWFYPTPGGDVNGYLDPTTCSGSLLQFAANGGPGEVANLRQNDRAFGYRNGAYGGMEYEAKMWIPAGTQLVHHYGSSWWKDRPELTRCNVGTVAWCRRFKDVTPNRSSLEMKHKHTFQTSSVDQLLSVLALPIFCPVKNHHEDHVYINYRFSFFSGNTTYLEREDQAQNAKKDNLEMRLWGYRCPIFNRKLTSTWLVLPWPKGENITGFVPQKGIPWLTICLNE